MADVRWIKICTDIFDDEKIKLIEALPEADAIIVIWFKLLCMAGKSNNNGVFMMSDKIPYTDEMLATILRRPISVIRLALTTFENFGMIETIDNVITIPNWEKHQSLDKLELAKEQTRLRVAKHREKQKMLANNGCNGNVTLPVTQSNGDRIEKNRLEENRKEEDKNKRFKKPTVEEIESYCKERNNNINANVFFDYYEAKGWLVGKSPMKDWKAAVRQWEHRDKENKKAVNDPFSGF